MTETEIAKKLKVDQSTVSRDIKVLKQMSQHFVYDLLNLTYFTVTNNVLMELKK
jgi:predicted amino acid racemase